VRIHAPSSSPEMEETAQYPCLNAPQRVAAKPEKEPNAGATEPRRQHLQGPHNQNRSQNPKTYLYVRKEAHSNRAKSPL